MFYVITIDLLGDDLMKLLLSAFVSHFAMPVSLLLSCHPVGTVIELWKQLPDEMIMGNMLSNISRMDLYLLLQSILI